MHTIIIKSDTEQPKQHHMAPGRNRKFIKFLFHQKIDFHIFSTKVLPMPGGDFNNFKQVRCENNEHNKDQRKHRNYSERPVTTSQIVMSWWKGAPNFVILFYIGKVSCVFLLFIKALWIILRCIFMKSTAQRKKSDRKSWVNRKSFSLLAGLVN